MLRVLNIQQWHLVYIYIYKKSVQTSHQQLARKVRRLYEGLKLYYDRFLSINGQEYSKIVQIIVKADRGKAIAWRSVSCKMTCYHIPDLKNSLDSQSAFCTHSAVCSLHFVPSLHFISGLQSAVCILYQQVSVAPIQFIFGNSYSHNTHDLPQNTCLWVNSTFSFFSALILFFPLVRM